MSDGVGIDSGGIYAYQICLFFMQHRVINSSYLLRKKQSDSVWTGLLQPSNRLQVFLVEQEFSGLFFVYSLLLSTYTEVL